MQHIIRFHKILALCALLGTFASLVACGQKGPLVLPSGAQPAAPSTPVETPKKP